MPVVYKTAVVPATADRCPPPPLPSLPRPAVIHVQEHLRGLLILGDVALHLVMGAGGSSAAGYNWTGKERGSGRIAGRFRPIRP